MAKKINFALEMADGYAVRHELEEYRAHFDLKKAIEHFTSGKLVEWLENNFYEEEAEAINQLDVDAPDFQRRLCETLGVELPETEGEEQDVDTIKRTQEKESLLRQKTSDDSVIANAAKTAFNRSDLVALWRAGEKTIYLCGDTFDIPIGDKTRNTKYIGVLGTPIIKIKAKSPEELKDKGIAFENVNLPWTQEESETALQKDSASHNENSGSTIPMEQLKEIFNSIYAKFLEKYENDKILEGRENIGIWDVMDLEQKQHYAEDCNATKKTIVLNLICKGKYTEDELIHVRVSKDFKCGWAFTKDSFCYGGTIGNGIIYYRDIAKMSVDNTNHDLHITGKEHVEYVVNGWNAEGSEVLVGFEGKALKTIQSYLEVVQNLYAAVNG